MAFTFQPKSDDQLAAESIFQILPDGDYPFRVTNAAEETSKAGNAMIHLEVTVFHGERVFRFDDYLLEKLAFKLKHFCAGTGLLDRYQQGSLTANDCLEKEGWLRLGKDKPRPKEGGGFFPDRNKINDYVPAPAAKTGFTKPLPTDAQLANLDPKGADSDVPF